MNYLLGLKNRRNGGDDMEVLWPWVLWSLWKSRNLLLFEGRRINPSATVIKGKQDMEEWRMALEVEKRVDQIGEEVRVTKKKKWYPPPPGWLMCNIAFDWSKSLGYLGTAWVVRNGRGVVLFHSRSTTRKQGHTEGKNRRYVVGITLFRRHTDETSPQK